MKYPESYLLPPARILPQRELDAVKIEGQNLLGEVTAGIYNVFNSYHGVGRFKTQSGEAPKGMHLRLASLKELDDALEFTRLYGPISEKFIYETKGKLKYSVQLKEFWRLQRCLLETLQHGMAFAGDLRFARFFWTPDTAPQFGAESEIGVEGFTSELPGRIVCRCVNGEELR